MGIWVLVYTVAEPSAAPRSDLWARWTVSNPHSVAVIDHTAWDAFLKKYVVTGPKGVNRLPYGQVAAEDRRKLDDYIDHLSGISIKSYRRPEQLAYWINLYNALTVRLILQRYPVESILDLNISPGWLSVGPWGKKLLRVEGEEISLDDIEHRILRPIWRDNRVHYGVNCASIGCPNLAKSAYVGATVGADLTRAARLYINGGRGVNFDDGDLYVSSIYKWFVADFGGNATGVIAHLKQYASPGLAAKLGNAGDISGYQYDWSLNETAISP
ncbi:MAG: DUF547 domain-containing protein [Rhodospirillales bacterium]|nr:DUF547 domain-containing protein [Rhodospirillales bacterium]